MSLRQNSGFSLLPYARLGLLMTPIPRPSGPMLNLPSCLLPIILLREGRPRVRSLMMTIALALKLRSRVAKPCLSMFISGSCDWLICAELLFVVPNSLPLHWKFLPRIPTPSSSWLLLIWFGCFAKEERIMVCQIRANHCKFPLIGLRPRSRGGRSSL